MYSYARQTNQTGWTRVDNFTGSGTGSAYFGYSVSLSADGTTLAVGELGTNSVWIYTAAPVGSGAWAVQRKLAQTDAGFSGAVRFGSAVALSTSGDTLVVGAYFYSSKGAAVVFSRNETDVWSVQSPILSDGSTDSFFGIIVSVNGAGNRMAVGARYDTVQGTDNGAVYIYFRNETTLNWNYSQRVLPSDSVSVTSRRFGQVLSLSSSGDTLVVGAPGEGAAGTDIGAWWHFEWNGTLFEQIGLKKVGQPAINNANQGYSIALSSGGDALIGLCLAALAMRLPVRHAYVLISHVSALHCLFVWRIGSVGARGEGSAYLWARHVSGVTDWQQISKLNDTEVGKNNFGAAVAMSGREMEFAIGGQYKQQTVMVAVVRSSSGHADGP